MITKKYCPYCKKVAVVASEQLFLGNKTKMFKCGHIVSERPLTPLPDNAAEIFTSKDGKHPYKYQITGAEHIIKSGGRALIADEMGLGKTIQALIPAKLNEVQLRPMLIIAKSGLRTQWFKETYRWTGLLSQIIESEHEPVIPGVEAFIVSMDLLWRFGTKQAEENIAQIFGRPTNKAEKEAFKKRVEEERNRIQPDVMAEFVGKLQAKYLILDEVQHIKNGESKRTNAVRYIAKAVEYIAALSGTPIKNHAGEYFPILNILAPDKFPTKSHFENRWCDQYFSGWTMKTGGLKDPKAFQEYTKDLIIRRTRKEVLPDLPAISREYRYNDLGEEVQKAYDQVLNEFSDYYDNGRGGQSAFAQYQNILGYFARMRYLTGMSKIESVVNLVEDFIMQTDRKLVIFLHHKDAHTLLLAQLSKIQKEWPAEFGKGVLEIKSEMDSAQRQQAVDNFWSKDYRIMIASTLAAGEGLNLQCASDCIIMERQWNPANEEQAEARFLRIGQESDKVTAMYTVAVGTIDEFLTELVERKRGYMSSTLDGKKMIWSEQSVIMELADILSKSNRKKWSY